MSDNSEQSNSLLEVQPVDEIDPLFRNSGEDLENQQPIGNGNEEILSNGSDIHYNPDWMSLYPITNESDIFLDTLQNESDDQEHKKSSLVKNNWWIRILCSILYLCGPSAFSISHAIMSGSLWLVVSVSFLIFIYTIYFTIDLATLLEQGDTSYMWYERVAHESVVNSGILPGWNEDFLGFIALINRCLFYGNAIVANTITVVSLIRYALVLAGVLE